MKREIKLIQVADSRKEAWQFSRPTFNHGDMDIADAVKMDIGFNSVCMLTFQIKSSMLFRDFIFTLRPLMCWAMSSRDVPFTKDNITISDEFESWGQDGIDEAIERVANGEHQNQARQSLPMTLSTQFTINLDFRSACGLIKSMKAIDDDLYECYGVLLEEAMKDVPGFEGNQIKSFEKSYLFSKDEGFKKPVEKLGGMINGCYKMNYAMMAQFLRQSHARIKTGIWDNIRRIGYFDSAKFYQSDKLAVEFYIPDADYSRLMSVRSHWFADWATDMWGGMIGDYTKDMTTEEFFNFIPCGNGKPDPFYYHTLKRVDRDDLNEPCPIALESPKLIAERFEAQGDNPVIQRYIEMAALGLINDNPDNELRKRYEQNCSQNK